MTDPGAAPRQPTPSEPGSPGSPDPDPGSGSGPLGSPPDPLKGFRGPVSATLVLEVIVVLLTLLVVSKFGGTNGGSLGVALVLLLAAAMVVLLRYAGRPWVVTAALGVQVVMTAGGLLVGALGALGVLFGLVWLLLLLLRRDVARKLARGELPSQQR